MTWWQAFILGLVQGVTEFLPVSSTGHLVLVQSWLGLTEELFTFDAMIHGGSLVAVIIAFRSELKQMLVAFGGGTDIEVQDGRRLCLLVLLGSIPLVVGGLLLKDRVAGAFGSVYLTSFMLFVTGVMLLIAEKCTPPPGEPAVPVARKVTVGKALVVGLSQCLAMLPGLSRSGTTISVGMMAGLDRQTSTRFSFLLSIPAITGAFLLALRTVLEEGFTDNVSALALGIGTLTAGVASYYSIILLLRFLKGNSFMGFVYYCWLLGGVMFYWTYATQGV